MTKGKAIDEVASRGSEKNSFCYLKKKMSFHIEPINYYQPFDKCSVNWFNTIKHHIARNTLYGKIVNTDF